MAEPVWNSFLTESDQAILNRTPLASRAGFGSRPAILVIDVTWMFTGDKKEPIVDSMRRWPMSCGEAAWNALPAMKSLISAGRVKGVPIIYTLYPKLSKEAWQMGAWRWKYSKQPSAEPNGESAEVDPLAIHDDIQPQPQDLIVSKLKPSGFHGTPLNSFLNLLAVDSLLVVGGVTSGCVRATVLDAFSENYRVSLIEEGLFDRFESAHAMNLFDMDAKYADVVSLQQALGYLSTLPEGMFDLPAGN